MNPEVSIIIPCYNTGPKLKSCLRSLDQLQEKIGIEAIFVDDKSTDETYHRIVDFGKKREWVVTHQLGENTGSPSTPRNVGLALASGEYIIFLDSDDEILPAGVEEALSVARRTKADSVRAPLIRDDGASRKIMNNFNNWDALRRPEQRVRAMVRDQSTTCTALYLRSFLVETQLTWRTDLHMAEDAVFFYEALASGQIEYSSEPLFIYNVRQIYGQTSATQRYEDAEMLNHVIAWTESQRILKDLGIDFFELRGQVALQAAIGSMIRNNFEGFSYHAFASLGGLLRSNPVVRQYSFGPRYSAVRDDLLADDYGAFLEDIKLRMVIAGHDLKFIADALPSLKKYYQVRVDEWLGHDVHDEGFSNSLLEWADLIFCEWLLGNAVWYAEHKQDWKRMVVRIHRFELTKRYGRELEADRVDRFIAIAPSILDEVQLTWGFQREKLSYIPNYLPIEDYEQTGPDSRVFNLAMIGFVPRLKGLRRALELLRSLRSQDSRYRLNLYGHLPESYDWVNGNGDEMTYFQECRSYIREFNLEDAVEYRGWVNTANALADVGFVLSLSDLEGSHVAAAEGFAAGGITVFREWEGVRFLYPQKYVFRNADEMASYILSCRNPTVFDTERAAGHEAVRELYGKDNFAKSVLRIMPRPQTIPG